VSVSIDDPSSAFSRRHLLKWLAGGVGVIIVGGAAGVELVNKGILPGKQYLNEIDGACDVTAPTLDYAVLGQSMSGTFYSRARHREVGYTLAYPTGHAAGDPIALVIMLHGYGGTHLDAFVDMTPVQASALVTTFVNNAAPVRRYAPVAVVTVDGGGGYWNPHPGDDPMGMVVDELIPMLQTRGVGRPSNGVGLMGISMGGYGALAIGERYPKEFRAIAAISPAVWTSFNQAHDANANAFASAADFAAHDVIAHAAALSHIPVRVASGVDDPFHPGVVQLIRALAPDSESYVGSGCHSSPFFLSQEPPSLAFLAAHLL
jgi:pimeloyl-ACP methyl ester carboxylesterase